MKLQILIKIEYNLQQSDTIFYIFPLDNIEKKDCCTFYYFYKLNSIPKVILQTLAFKRKEANTLFTRNQGHKISQGSQGIFSQKKFQRKETVLDHLAVTAIQHWLCLNIQALEY